MGHFQTRDNQLHLSSTAAARTGRHEAVQISLLLVISESCFHHVVGLRVIRVFQMFTVSSHCHRVIGLTLQRSFIYFCTRTRRIIKYGLNETRALNWKIPINCCGNWRKYSSCELRHDCDDLRFMFKMSPCLSSWLQWREWTYHYIQVIMCLAL